eukprot:TRINITY_DN11080_c0_g1_i1.p1 TRINITY_DN11080_c0_g1~~TRINITY_DN11080_c0_g1_i1.p1  ORF type:complete len:111 (-),score=12.71 TRINITY_DN11080_c0_g1_i1:100-432(-)
MSIHYLDRLIINTGISSLSLSLSLVLQYHSKPAERLPIPDVVVRVYFTISNFTQPILTYFIENQRIVHDAEQTKFQEHWLDYVVAQKKTLSSAMGPTPSERLKPAEINRP